MQLFGRTKIMTDEVEITEDNLLSVLSKALTVHLRNRAQIEYLYGYYRGKQPILERIRDVRPELTSNVVENRANEIVSFKVGYLMGEPVQYVSRSDDESVNAAISKLNDFCLSESKAAKDKELAEWWNICGTSYRMILPDAEAGVDPDEAPFEIYTLDPRNTFVVYTTDLGEKPVMAVRYVRRADRNTLYCIYTPTRYFEVLNQTTITKAVITKAESHMLGWIPIIEYPANNARLGAFEIVLPLLDAINETDTNRDEAVSGFVQALMLFKNCDISSDDFSKLRQQGALKYRDIDQNFKAEIKYLTEELNQSQTQTLVDHMYQTVLTICGMPNRNGGSSTSDTGSAVVYRDGWESAEARAKDSELMFKLSESQFLKIALNICSTLKEFKLPLSAIEIKFTRRNYENILQKANVLNLMLNNSKIDPRLAFIHCGMFADPEEAYAMSQKYYQSTQESVQTESETEGDADGADGQTIDAGSDS